MDPQFIRNFCIIAHIDHGKSTLADRLLELTGALSPAGNDRAGARLHGPGARARHHHQSQKHSSALHSAKDGHEYRLNLIDTPGHVDFSYEVSRALSACEGALLVVDASQGVEAQTVANAFLAAATQSRDHSGDQQNRFARRPDRFRQRADRKRSRRFRRTTPFPSAPKVVSACETCSKPSCARSRAQRSAPKRRCRR